MISKQFKLISTLLAIVGISLFVYFQYQMQPEELVGYKEGTEEYFGYRYAQDNKLESADQCDDEKDDLEMNINEKFIKGCVSYF